MTLEHPTEQQTEQEAIASMMSMKDSWQEHMIKTGRYEEIEKMQKKERAFTREIKAAYPDTFHTYKLYEMLAAGGTIEADKHVSYDFPTPEHSIERFVEENYTIRD